MARCCSASVAVGFETVAFDVSRFECQRQFGLEENLGVRKVCRGSLEVVKGTLALTEECV